MVDCNGDGDSQIEFAGIDYRLDLLNSIITQFSIAKDVYSYKRGKNI